jgi:hypothetical protein
MIFTEFAVMHLFDILRVSPAAALAICVSLFTVAATIAILRKQFGIPRFLLAVVGLLSVCQGLRILISQGIIATSNLQRNEGIVDAGIAALFLVALLLLKSANSELLRTRAKLRLSEGRCAVLYLNRESSKPDLLPSIAAASETA